MSVLVEVEQRSDEWLKLRCGVATASCFDKIITPATGKASASAVAYRRELLAEWLTGQPVSIKESGWMQRGTEMEPEARAFYEFEADAEVVETGITFLDERRLIGCSPDGLVGSDGLVEIKCPAPHTHVGYLLDGRLPTAYIPQVQGALWVTGRQWCDFVSYSDTMESLIVRVNRDESYIAKMATLIEAFVKVMLEERQILLSRGIRPKE
jgi:putative phage-type endonuclease